MALAVLAALVACGPERTKTPPDELIGTWKTSAPKYADTFIELTRTTIVFGFGDGKADVRSIVAVEKVRENGDILYTVFYKDEEGTQYKLAFYYDPANAGVMRWKNQRTIAWTRVRR